MITMRYQPSYIQTHSRGLLKEKICKAYELLRNCTICPRRCNVDRTSGERGLCRTGSDAVIYSFDAHFGEEAPLVGKNGSGTIFFSFCNMLCSFCQNYQISHRGEGREVTIEQLAFMMVSLQKQGCHNINLVTPSHVVPQILAALEMAIEDGLSIPIVYNTGGYDAIETLQLLEGVVDIYMPDIKFNDPEAAELAGLPTDYPEVVKRATLEMFRQVGDLVVESSGVASRGVLVRHLVMPYGLAGTEGVMRFLNRDVSKNIYVNIMSQYRPCGRAFKIEELSRPVSYEEYHEAVRIAVKEGIRRFDH